MKQNTVSVSLVLVVFCLFASCRRTEHSNPTPATNSSISHREVVVILPPVISVQQRTGASRAEQKEAHS